MSQLSGQSITRPCAHATAEVAVCVRCERRRARCRANKVTYLRANPDVTSAGRPYGVVRLSWTAPEMRHD